MKIAFFGSSLVSAYWNGAATYYRGLIRPGRARPPVTFFEPDAFDRQQHRDIADPDWARRRRLRRRPADGVAARWPRRARRRPRRQGERRRRVRRAPRGARSLDAPAAGSARRLLGRRCAGDARPGGRDPGDPFRRADARATTSSSPTAAATRSCDAYERARRAALRADLQRARSRTHHPVPPDPRFAADLGFLGNRLPDREARVEEFFLRRRARCRERRFLLGGSGWDDKPMPANVRYARPRLHRAITTRSTRAAAVLNVNRDSMAALRLLPGRPASSRRPAPARA